jgi:hypothetical protein
MKQVQYLESTNISCAIEQTFVAMATWHLGFVYPCKTVTLKYILEEAAVCIFKLEESRFKFNAELTQRQ